ncbi:hypothetical protein JVU11DRAFT_10431 [Chiua virens]|nr:hypothetical protein JVU11DRAFT_10431 [Chiua virens]
MLIGLLEVRCQRSLEEIVGTLRRIQSKHSQFSTVPQQAGSNLMVITKASVADDTLDDRIMDWFIRGELNSCTEKLKEVDDMLERSVLDEDKVTAVMDSLEDFISCLLTTRDSVSSHRKRLEPIMLL